MQSIYQNNLDLDSAGNSLRKTSVECFDLEELRNISFRKYNKLKHFSEIKRSGYRVFASDDIFHAIDRSTLEHSGFRVELISKEEFPKSAKKFPFGPAIIVLNNNTVEFSYGRDEFKAAVEEHKDVLFVVWDFDNHHWIRNSFFCAKTADIYIPAHFENITNLSYLAGHSIDVVPCGIGQFTINQMANYISMQSSELAPRRRITGMHRKYDQFPSRNFLINLFHQVAPDDVGFTPNNFHDPKNYGSNFSYWSSFCCSIVIPVHGDVPIRFFDTLGAGGIPIVPFYLKNVLDRFGIPENFYLKYHFDDLLSPDVLVESACRKFADGGTSGIVERISFAIDNHHITQSLRKILALSEELVASRVLRLPQHFQ
jgi:hypothetical protein